MVRLKEFDGNLKELADSTFQFHNGSIKSSHKILGDYQLAEFQFHNGSIKSAKLDYSLGETCQFQFHNGSIKSPKNQRIYYRKSALFLQAENYLYFQKSSTSGCAKFTGG